MHMQLINSYRIPFSTLISYIPIIATIVTTLFSVILARATLRYVEATDKGLALAREEFEREWSPDLHIKMERVSATRSQSHRHQSGEDFRAAATVAIAQALARHALRALPPERSSGRRHDLDAGNGQAHPGLHRTRNSKAPSPPR